MLSECFLEFPSVEASRAFPEFSPPQCGWGRLFFQKWFRRGPLRAGHGIPSSTGAFLISIFLKKNTPTINLWGYLKLVMIKPVIRMFHMFCVCSLHFPCFGSVESPQTLVSLRAQRLKYFQELPPGLKLPSENGISSKPPTKALFCGDFRKWADPGVLWKKAPRAMRAMRGKTLETVPFQPYFGYTKSFLKVLSN